MTNNRDYSLEDYEATVSRLPVFSGDGYDYGGSYIVSIGPYAIQMGTHQHDLAKEIAARWNDQRGKRCRAMHED